MFQFYWPWFSLLLPLPLLIRRFLASKTAEHQIAEIHFPAIQRLKGAFSAFQNEQKSSSLFPLSVLTLSWVFFIIALMQPERVDQVSQINHEGYDLMLAVDISASMQALDFSTPHRKVSRLDAAKEVVGRFVQGRKGDRVGLVAFGEHAYLHVPLTLDTLSVSKMLNETISGMAGQATAIGDAIGISVRTLRDRPEGSRVLILLTDGEDNSSRIPPLEAAKLAKQYGIKIYTIGMGKSGAVPFPAQSGGYAMVQVSIDEKSLKEIADMTGGGFFLAKDEKMLENIYKKINELEKTTAEETILLIRDPLYAYPLGLAMALLLLLSIWQIYPWSVSRGY